MAWLRSTTQDQRRTLLAAYAGYGLDGFDFMIYSFIIPSLLTLWNMSKAEAGYIATGALLTSAVGGWAAGILADRYGRARILQLTVLWFALFTCLSGFTHSFGQLLFTRAMQGFGSAASGRWARCWWPKSSIPGTAAKRQVWYRAAGRWAGLRLPSRFGP